MKPIILYASKGGNTGKIARGIAKELNCGGVQITQTGLAGSFDLDSYDLIFVGTGIHYGSPNEDLLTYLKTMRLKEPKLFALFLTWGGAGRTSQDAIVKLRTILESKGQRVTDDCFVCYGGWNFLRRGHPNQEDANAAIAWAKKTASIIL
jgi:flavodoxin